LNVPLRLVCHSHIWGNTICRTPFPVPLRVEVSTVNGQPSSKLF